MVGRARTKTSPHNICRSEVRAPLDPFSGDCPALDLRPTTLADILYWHGDTYQNGRIVERPLNVRVELAGKGFQNGAGSARARALLFLQAESIVRDLEEQRAMLEPERELQLSMPLPVGMGERIDDDFVEQERHR